MALASTSRVQLSYIKEVDFGVTPTTGTARKLRITGESLNFTVNKETSSEINDSRSSSSMIPTSAEAAGGVQAEMQFAEYDPFIEATLQGTFSGIGGTGVSTAFRPLSLLPLSPPVRLLLVLALSLLCSQVSGLLCLVLRLPMTVSCSVSARLRHLLPRSSHLILALPELLVAHTPLRRSWLLG